MRTTLSASLTSLNVLGVFPDAWTLVRTHLVPKTDDIVPKVADHRPLSITSIWYRVWGSYRLHMLPLETHDVFGPHLRGGLTGRGVDDMVTHPMLWVEAAANGCLWEGLPTQCHLLSLDAVKCFDHILGTLLLPHHLMLSCPRVWLVCLPATGLALNAICHALASLMDPLSLLVMLPIRSSVQCLSPAVGVLGLVPWDAHRARTWTTAVC